MPRPEDAARADIDAALLAAGWVVQDRDAINLDAGIGVAVREFPLRQGYGFADYLLRQAVLEHAFEGKLVPQDPNDEPASALLARLRAEQAPAPNGDEKAPRGGRARVRRGASRGESTDG
jgi:hypothetical protein